MPNKNNKHKQKNKKNQSQCENGIINKDDGVLPTTTTTTTTATMISMPYEIKHSDIFGRYLVAAKDLDASEIIIQQKPLAIGPIANDDNIPICINCYRSLASLNNCYRCHECAFPLCSDKCNDRDHTPIECKFFKDHSLGKYLHLKPVNKIGLQNDFETIIILRCLLLKSNSKLWQQLNEMEAHNEIRRNIPALWSRNQNVIVNRIRNQWKILEFSEEEIHTICGFLEVNCFEVGQNGSNSARALFPEAYLLCHDCIPNTNHTDDATTHELIIRTTKPLKKGEVITLSYAYTLQGTLKRRNHLHEAKFFWCSCARCSSADELGTNASTLLCPKCNKGLIISTKPLNQDATWNCKNCKFSLPGSSVMNLVTRLYDELDAIDGNDVNGMENFITKYSTSLHRNHYIFLSAKHSLCQLYGKIDGFLINELSIDQLKKKEQYCRDFLEVIDVLEPGTSRLRGVVLYELHAPVMLQITRDLQCNRIKVSEFKQRLKEVVQILQKSYDILKLEPTGSSENSMALAAKSALDSISNAQ